MSSANFTIRFPLGSANCMSLTTKMKEEQDGAKDSSLMHASIDSYKLCVYSVNHNPLFSSTQEVKDPVDHTGIYTCCRKLVREDVIRNSIGCFAEVKWHYADKVCVPIQIFPPIMLGLHKRHCGLRIFFVGELNRSYEWLEDVRQLKFEY